MTVLKLGIPIIRYVGHSTDIKPATEVSSGTAALVPVGSTFLEYDTGQLYINYNGTNWEVKTSPPYEFTINGVNFNGHEKIRTLMLPSDCANGAFLAFTYDDGSSEEDYVVPDEKVFIAFQALVWESGATGIAMVGETADGNTPFTKEVLFLSNGTVNPSMESCWGTFAAGKVVTASSITSTFKGGSALYGVEVDA